MTTLLWVAGHLVCLAVFALICHGAGGLVISGLQTSNAFVRSAIASALGWTLFGQFLLVLGATGRLTRTNVLIVLGVMAIAAIAHVRSFRASDLLRMVHENRAAAFAVAVALLFPLILALYPPIAFDATLYHLPFAKRFAEAGALVLVPELRFPIFPQFNEVIFSAALLVWSDSLAQLTQWFATAATSLAVAGLAVDTGRPRAALLACALWVGAPLVVYLAGSAYIEPGLTLAVTAGLVAWREWTLRGDLRWCAVAGALFGAAAASKYHGLFFIATFVVSSLFVKRRERVLAAAAVLVMAIVIAGPWYLRIVRYTGNPIFPYMTQVFGTNEYATNLDRRVDALTREPSALIAKASPAKVVRFLWRQGIAEPRAVGKPLHSPWMIVLFPLAIAGAVRDRSLFIPGIVAVVYVILMVPLDWRFFVPVLPVLSVCIAVVLCGRPGGLHLRHAVATAMLFVLPGVVYGAVHLRRCAEVPPATPQARAAYLDRRLPLHGLLSRMQAGRDPNATLFVVGAENLAYYWDGRLLGDHYGPWRNQLLRPYRKQPALLARKLREWDVRYLIVTPQAGFANLDGADFTRIAATEAGTAWELRRDGRTGSGS